MLYSEHIKLNTVLPCVTLGAVEVAWVVPGLEWWHRTTLVGLGSVGWVGLNRLRWHLDPLNYKYSDRALQHKGGEEALVWKKISNYLALTHVFKKEVEMWCFFLFFFFFVKSNSDVKCSFEVISLQLSAIWKAFHTAALSPSSTGLTAFITSESLFGKVCWVLSKKASHVLVCSSSQSQHLNDKMIKVNLVFIRFEVHFNKRILHLRQEKRSFLVTGHQQASWHLIRCV